jgi:hypothetical protein
MPWRRMRVGELKYTAHWTGVWFGLRTGLDALGEVPSPYQESRSDSPGYLTYKRKPECEY